MNNLKSISFVLIFLVSAAASAVSTGYIINTSDRKIIVSFAEYKGKTPTQKEYDVRHAERYGQTHVPFPTSLTFEVQPGKQQPIPEELQGATYIVAVKADSISASSAPEHITPYMSVVINEPKLGILEVVIANQLVPVFPELHDKALESIREKYGRSYKQK